MDDEAELKLELVSTPVKHTKWSLIVLAVDLISNIAQEFANTMDTLTTITSQHRMHRIEEDNFYEIVEED